MDKKLIFCLILQLKPDTLNNQGYRKMTEQDILPPNLGDYFLGITDTFFVVVKDDEIVNANPAAQKILSLTEDEITGKPVLEIIADSDQEQFQQALASKKRVDYMNIHVKNKSGILIDMLVRIVPIFVNNEKICLVEAQNQTPVVNLEKKCKLLEERLINVSPIDARTNLPSPVLFNDRVDQAILRALREARGVLSDVTAYLMIVVVDIIGLDDIELTHGADAKKFVIETLVSRFKSSIRSVDTVAKGPGNSFYFLFENVRDKQNIYIITGRLRGCTNLPITFKDQHLTVGMEIGFSSYPDNGTSPMALIKWAKLNNRS